MPLLHAEDPEHQKLSVRLYDELFQNATSGSTQVLDRFNKIAGRHEKVIQLFGRFPERNMYLGRTSSTEEAAYLSG